MEYFNKVEIVKVALTHECNLACPYCSDNLSKCKKDQFEHEEACIKWLKTLPKLRIVTMYGGEPLLSDKCIPYIKRLLQEIPFPVRICIFTNGTIFSEELVELLKNPRVTINLTRSSDKLSQDARLFKSTGESSYDIVTTNVKRLYELIGPRLLLVDTLLQQNLNGLSDSLIEDFKYSDFVEMNLIRSQKEMTDFDILGKELEKVVDFLVDNPDKCLKNFSKRPPIDREFKRDWYLFIQGTYTDYVNGIKNVLVDIDGKVYPGTSVAGKGYSMGDIFGGVNEENYKLFFNSKDDCDCEYKYMCVPNYENYNPDGEKLPFKHHSHCNYFETLYNAMSNYYKRLKKKGLV